METKRTEIQTLTVEHDDRGKIVFEKVLSRALRILSEKDFAVVNGRIEITRDGILKLLSSLPVEYETTIIEKEITNEYALVRVQVTVTFSKAGIQRKCESMGVCEKTELEKSGNVSLHNMLTKAETRALKRALETIFGSVVNHVILTLFKSYTVTK